MKNDFTSAIKLFLEIMGVTLMVLIIIGFFNTPFENNKPTLLSQELLLEREYVETIQPAIENFSEQIVTLEETNKLSQNGKIVPLKVSQIYSNIFSEMQEDYKELSYLEVPERFQQFHTSFLKCMELKGASINELLTYLTDSESSHLSTIEKYNDSFKTKYSNAITTFNRLLNEKKLR